MKTIQVKVDDELYYKIIAYEKMNKKLKLNSDRSVLISLGFKWLFEDNIDDEDELKIYKSELAKIKMKDLNKRLNEL